MTIKTSITVRGGLVLSSPWSREAINAARQSAFDNFKLVFEIPVFTLLAPAGTVLVDVDVSSVSLVGPEVLDLGPGKPFVEETAGLNDEPIVMGAAKGRTVN